MNRVVVVTDSTCNLPADLVTGYDIPIIPLNVHWGDESYRDGATLKPKQFYEWLKERDTFPTTSQPSVGDFKDFFEGVAERRGTESIVGIFLSSDLSGTLASAIQARALLPDLNIELVDSRTVSIPLGFQVLAGVEAAHAGGGVPEVMAATQAVRESSSVLFTVGTLEYLHRGGRIGGAARLFGTALNLKPLLTIEDGRVEVLQKIRSQRKALRRMLNVMEERLSGRRPTAVGVIDVDAVEEADDLAAAVVERFNPARLYRTTVTPVIGAHAGPGTLGIGFYV